MNPADFLALISRRHCQRAFTDEPVEREIMESVLLAAGQAPSGKNTQPAFDTGEKPASDYEYSLLPSPEEWKDRARACGYSLFELKGIARDDVEARKAHGRENFTFFGAPVQLVFHLPAGAERGNFLDVGMFMQNVMLGLTAYGLGSCPQFSVAGYASVVRESLGLAADRWVVAGMSVGWPEKEARVNAFVPERLPLADFVDWRE